MPSEKLIGKIVIHAILENKTPLRVGKGGGAESGAEIVCLPDGRPFVPGSSLAGCMKQAMKINRADAPIQPLELEKFWGSEMADQKITWQSHVLFDSMIPDKQASNKIRERDGVKIDPVKGVAEYKKKYEYDLIEPGVQFPFRVEITLREDFDVAVFTQLAGDMMQALQHDFRLGALTNHGFGKLAVVGESLKAVYFSFPTAGADWFRYLEAEDVSLPFPNAQEIKHEGKAPNPQKDVFHLKASFSLCSSLLIGAHGLDADDPDKMQLMSNGKPVLTGKSIRGAIRHRALKILKTLDVQEAASRLHSLFGFVDETRPELRAIKGKLRIEECDLGDPSQMMNQARIRIDRFTGGVIDGALFECKPLWKKKGSTFSLEFRIQNFKEWEAALLLHLLRDLWTEDLAIGGEKNVGRGVLSGKTATITFNQKVIRFEKEASRSAIRFTEGTAADLSTFNKPLHTILVESEEQDEN